MIHDARCIGEPSCRALPNPKLSWGETPRSARELRVNRQLAGAVSSDHRR
jgi:hypothetical protein